MNSHSKYLLYNQIMINLKNSSQTFPKIMKNFMSNTIQISENTNKIYTILNLNLRNLKCCMKLPSKNEND